MLTDREYKDLKCLIFEGGAVCPCCGVKFCPTRRDNRYCSSKCAEKHWHDIRVERKDTVCPECGRSFRKKRGGQVYCSTSCAAVARNKRKAKEREK